MNQRRDNQRVVDVEVACLAQLVQFVGEVVHLSIQEPPKELRQHRIQALFAEIVDCVDENVLKQVVCCFVKVFFDKVRMLSDRLTTQSNH